MWYVFLAIAFAASLQPLTVCGSLVCGRLLSAANSEFDDVSSGAPFVVTVCFASASCRTNLKLDLHTAEYFSDIRRAVRTRDGSYLSACDKSKLEARQTLPVAKTWVPVIHWHQCHPSATMTVPTWLARERRHDSTPPILCAHARRARRTSSTRSVLYGHEGRSLRK